MHDESNALLLVGQFAPIIMARQIDGSMVTRSGQTIRVLVVDGEEYIREMADSRCLDLVIGGEGGLFDHILCRNLMISLRKGHRRTS